MGAFLTRQRILVADDDPGIRQTLGIALTRAGYEVVAARDGKEALRLWRDGGADLVITDLHMPDRNGLELLMELRRESPSLPIMVMSDGGRTKQIELLGDAKLLGAIQTLSKPFSLNEMLAAVRAILTA